MAKTILLSLDLLTPQKNYQPFDKQTLQSKMFFSLEQKCIVLLISTVNPYSVQLVPYIYGVKDI